MTIDFNLMDETVIHNFRGGLKDTATRMFADERNRIMLARLEPCASIGTHAHETSSEIVYILQGSATALISGVRETLSPGMCHYCPKGSTHSLVNSGGEDLVFFAVVPEQ